MDEVAQLKKALYELWWWVCHTDEPYPDTGAEEIRQLLKGYDPREL